MYDFYDRVEEFFLSAEEFLSLAQAERPDQERVLRNLEEALKKTAEGLQPARQERGYEILSPEVDP